METWTEITLCRFKGLYIISSLGNIYSLPRTDSLGRKKKGKMLKKDLSGKYPAIELSNKGESKRFLIHRLLGKEFIANPSNKPQINHINGIKTDNRIENLEWCTSSENNYHSFHTLKNKVLPYMGKTILQFSLKGDFIKEFKSMEEAKKIMGRKSIDISKACCGKRKSAGGFAWKYKN